MMVSDICSFGAIKDLCGGRPQQPSETPQLPWVDVSHAGWHCQAGFTGTATRACNERSVSSLVVNDKAPKRDELRASGGCDRTHKSQVASRARSVGSRGVWVNQELQRCASPVRVARPLLVGGFECDMGSSNTLLTSSLLVDPVLLASTLAGTSYSARAT